MNRYYGMIIVKFEDIRSQQHETWVSVYSDDETGKYLLNTCQAETFPYQRQTIIKLWKTYPGYVHDRIR